MNTQYEAVVHRDNRWWVIEIPAIAGITRSRRLSDAREAARNCIAVTTKASPADVDVVIVDVVVPRPDGNVRHLLDETTQVRETQRKLEEAAAAVVRDFVTELTTGDTRIPVRDIGFLMDLTPGRISQLSKQAQHRADADPLPH
ncbi:hypothetical protein A5742_17600 [Mycolicibacterium fortuitum]|uniref:HicB family toxin-antitoxin system n=1 Tax=Mycolicibacterium fortuitum TaxID=1766 RepID=A0ABD6QTU8_MYCFO|nr:hypothetical protein [Mycolicibacterium fortuitum]OMC51949.1 hypothetical protein A5742_17600 [Mycolicibacterium fortuitum]